MLPAVIGQLEPAGPAEQAGLKSGDRVLRAGGEALSDWMSLVNYVRQHPDQTIEFEIERNGSTQIISINTGSKKAETKTIGHIGAAPAAPGPLPAELSAREEYSLLPALWHSLTKTWQMSSLTLRMIGKMIIGEVSVKNLSGPITIATYAGYTASVGLGAFLYFLAIVSISLGVLNLLPVPLLDGGHLMYYLIEMVKGSPLSDAVQVQMQRLGIAFLLMLMTLALYNDVMRLFAG